MQNRFQIRYSVNLALDCRVICHDYTHDRIKINASSRRIILPEPLDHVRSWQVAERWLSSMMNPVIKLISVRAFDRHWASELLAVPNVEVASLPFVEHEG